MSTAEWLTMNEKRQEMGFDRLDNPTFDEPWLSLNKMPLSEIMMEPTNPEEEAKALLEEYSRNGIN